MSEQQITDMESVTDHLRRIGVGWTTATLPNGRKVILIRLDKLRIAEGGEWRP